MGGEFQFPSRCRCELRLIKQRLGLRAMRTAKAPVPEGG